MDTKGRLNVRERYARGRALRREVPRGGHAGWDPPADRRGPAEVLAEQDADRLADLVPVRRERMAASPFAFLRGAAAVMAGDLAAAPSTGLLVQACGDAHLLNFGVYASPERTLLFDVNDFDETLPAPWEWDVKRLAASLAVAARENGLADGECRKIVVTAAGTYRSQLRVFAGMRDLDVFYARMRAEDLLAQIKESSSRKRGRRALRKAERRDNLQALDKLTTVVDGRLRIVDDPPLLEHTDLPDVASAPGVYRAYNRTLREDSAALLGRYRFIDAARKVVGVGSVGTRCYVVVLEGRDSGDPLVLQVKEAQRSVLEPYARRSVHANQGRRVVVGQRLMQAASDSFLGWTKGNDGRHYYWRQLRDMKGSADVTLMSARELAFYGGACAWALALAHANTGDRIQIAGYLGSGTVFDLAIADFAIAYAAQNDLDHKAFQQHAGQRVTRTAAP